MTIMRRKEQAGNVKGVGFVEACSFMASITSSSVTDLDFRGHLASGWRENSQ